jgi:aryl-alcohol dehydrogenase-like predicted oxidoreductase
MSMTSEPETTVESPVDAPLSGPTVQLGESPCTVSRVIFGAWAIGGWWWGGSDDAAAVGAIHASIDAGAFTIDTAPMYGCGHSERVVGQAVRERRDEVVLLTKVGLRWDDERGVPFFSTEHESRPIQVRRNLRGDSIRTELSRSLERMGVERIDLLQCHWPDASTPVEETMDALADLVDEGLVGAVGVSNFDVPLLERSWRRLRARGLALASNQPRYSMLDREIEAEILPWCRRHRVGTLAYSPLAQGLLTGKMTAERQLGEGDERAHQPRFQPAARRATTAALAAWGPIAAAHDCTLAQLALAWCLHQPGLSAVIAGARTPLQARENARAVEISLTVDERSRMAAALEGLS